MNEGEWRCPKCDHRYHAYASCGTWGPVNGTCGCDGVGKVGILDLSGFCFAYNHETAQHTDCPGDDYTYPCECPCHGDPFEDLPDEA